MRDKKVIHSSFTNISNDKYIYIIAEIGINHNGNMSLARKMIKLAARTGADGVKFQLYDTDNLLIKTTPKTEYQKKP